MKKNVVIIIMIFVIIIGCAISKSRSTTEKSDTKGKIIYNSYDEKFSVEADSSWQNVNKGELNKLANLEIVDYSKNKYFMSIMEKKEDFKLNYNEYKDYMLKDIEKTYNVKLDTKKEIEIDNKKSTYVEFKSSAPNSSINMYMHVYIVETKNYYGRLFAWTNYSNRDIYKEEFNDMVKTFKEK